MLTVDELTVAYPGTHGHVAVRSASFELRDGHALGLVGESGSGKSTIAKAIVGLAPITSGEVRLDGETVARHGVRPRGLRDRVQYVYQDASASLNPRMRIGETLAETAAIAAGGTLRAQRGRVAELLSVVGLSAAHAERFPHELSGGQRQRVAIARALATRARTLLLDEVTSALDVSVQATVLNLLNRLRRDLRLSLLVISHDLAVVRLLCDDVVVLRPGEICETGPAERVLRSPQHEYTRSLLAAVPTLTRARAAAQADEGDT
ncbi:ABC transporter ATP-binding protein [Jiangella anatolica]|uniref:ABC transporter ATP-binding protein n=1 Tax=Jiangella anatolica TaxID=2670374 RepID=UPI0018F5F58E|nr:ATP-binding cassette domain-containing protein [Jiangella anatolica]